MASLDELLSGTGPATDTDDDSSRVGGFTSFFAGIGSGLIDIPRGLFSLGASLVDLGFDTDLAGRVENAFDTIDPFDEMAEATAIGRFSKLFGNVIIPSTVGFKVGTTAAKAATFFAKRALDAKRKGKYFDAKAASKSDEIKDALSFKQKVFVGAGGALGAGAADAIFTAETNIDNFRPLFTKPLDLSFEGRESAADQLVRRVQFGTEGAVFTGLIGGALYGIKALRNRTINLESDNKALDDFFSLFRPRGKKQQELFEAERLNLGERRLDIAEVGQSARDLDKTIDGMFPFLDRIFLRSGTAAKRTEILEAVDKSLLSGLDDTIFEETPMALLKFGFEKKPNEVATKTIKFFGDTIADARRKAGEYAKAKGLKKKRIIGGRDLKVNLGNVELFPKTGTDVLDETKELIRLVKENGGGAKEIQGIYRSINKTRDQISSLFTSLGSKMNLEQQREFKRLFGQKVKNYLGSTYEIFENKPLLGMFGYKPAEEAVDRLAALFMKYDDTLKPQEAIKKVSDIVASARRGGEGIRMDDGRALGALIKVDEKFLKDMVDPDSIEYIAGKGSQRLVGVEFLEKEAREAVEAVLGKLNDPFVTMLKGVNRLSLITRRNEYLDTVGEVNRKNIEEDIAQGLTGPNRKQFLFDDTSDAALKFGHANVRAINLDQAGKLDFGGRKNPLNGKITDAKLAEAFEEASGKISAERWYHSAYNNFILYPKATAQLAKTDLSPITHIRNLLSAGAFATANGLIPGITVNPAEFSKAMREAYKALDVKFIGTDKNRGFYNKMLKLGVVNTQTQVGDMSRLLRDIKYGETLVTTSGIGPFFKMLSRAKKWSQDMYTAEDDIWKMTTFGLERSRIEKAFNKHGIAKNETFTDEIGNTFKLNDDFLDERAAAIVRNNVPNYDYVSDFIKDLRRLPFGNFVSFPAEIMRTSANILESGLREVNETFVRQDGKFIKPLRSIGYKRLVGFGTTVAVVPYGTQEAFKAIHNVSEDEMEALKRYVPSWSKNSTLLPIKTDDGKMKYIDFSHANAYDLLIRPINTVINASTRGLSPDARMKDEIVKGIFEATKELGEPFIGESIWSQAVADIIIRGGRTGTGSRLYTDQTPVGERITKIFKHLVKSQAPFSYLQMKRLGLAINEKADAYGTRFELSDELAGFAGLRAVEVDPIKSIRFKIADFNVGMSNSRREFTSPLLKGGEVTPEQIIERFDVANTAMFNVQKEIFKDYYGALRLGADKRLLDKQFEGRVSDKKLKSIQRGNFEPFLPSENIEEAFRDNARSLGVANPYLVAKKSILGRYKLYNKLPLLLDFLPVLQNPFTDLGGGIVNTGAASNISNAITTPQAVTPSITPNNMQNTLVKLNTLDDFISP